MKKTNYLKKSATTLKSLLLLVLFTALMGNAGWGQTAAGYAFSTGTGSSLLAPTLTQIIASGNDDGTSTLQNIGFTFVYEGTSYTQFSANSNGLVRLGSTTITGEYSNITTSTINQPKLMPLWDDLSTASNGSVSFGISGSSPSRICVIDYKLYNTYSTGSTYTLSFQVWLHETSNNITFVYGTGTTPSSSTCGIGGATASNYQSVTTSTHTSSNSVVNDENMAWPGSGRYYLFSPCISPTVSTTTASSITSTSASSGGNVTIEGASAVTAKGVCWSTSANPLVTGSHTTDGTGLGSFTSSITGLTPGMTYYYRAYATNGCSTAYGAEYSFTTPCADPSAQASNVTFSGVTDQQMTVNWTAPGGTSADGVIVVAKAGSAPDAPSDGTSYTANAAFGSGTQIGTGTYVVFMGGGTSVTVTGLTASTTYYFAVYAKNCTGTSIMINTTNPATGSQTTNACTSAGLSGTKNIPGDYASLTKTGGLFAAINTNGLGGNLIVNITADITEDGAIALNQITEYCGTGYTILIQPSGGSRKISGAKATGPLIKLNGADRVTFDGLNGSYTLTIANTSATAGASTFQFTNDATYNTLNQCKIYSSNTSTSSGTIEFLTYNATTATGNDFNTIDSCEIYDGATAPYVGIYSSGTTTATANYNSNNTISNNKIYNFINPSGTDASDPPAAGVFNTGTDFGVKIYSGSTNWTISGNSFYQNRTSTPYSNGTGATHYAIYVSNTSGVGFIIENNYIGGTLPNCGGSAWTINQSTVNSNFTGIHLDVGVGSQSRIYNNVIDNISLTTKSAGTSQDAPFIGILVRGYLDVSNNTLGGTHGIVYSSTTAAADFDGIYQFDESANAIGTYVTNNNSISNITISNTSSSNANVYLMRGYSKNYQTTWTCNNNLIGGPTANSINCQNYHWVHGIFFSWGTSISATGNTIQNITCGYSGIHGIKEQSDAGGATTSSTYSGNTIRSLKVSNGGTVNGILIDGGNSTNNVIERNLIHSLDGGTVMAINHSNGKSSFSDIIRNNMIALGNTVGTSTTRGIRYEGNTGTCNIYHNSVYMHGSSASTYCMDKNTSATACNVKNNIFYNNCSSAAEKYALYYSNTTGLTSDCNDLYVPSAQTGYIPSTGYTTLANWQGGTVYDANSVSIDPGFLSLTVPYDLHVDSGIQIFSCTGLVTDDFDGTGRTVPHMGADESNITLPVELLAFSAVCSGNAVRLQWATASEQNNDYFTLERSEDAKTWKEMAEIPGAGNSNQIMNYSYSDTEPLEGTAYYRLRQTDYDGRSETFKSVACNCSAADAPTLSLYPNPFNDALMLQFANITADQVNITVLDVTGRTVLAQSYDAASLQENVLTLDLSSLRSGSYMVRFTAGDFIGVRHIVKE